MPMPPLVRRRSHSRMCTLGDTELRLRWDEYERLAHARTRGSPFFHPRSHRSEDRACCSRRPVRVHSTIAVSLAASEKRWNLPPATRLRLQSPQAHTCLPREWTSLGILLDPHRGHLLSCRYTRSLALSVSFFAPLFAALSYYPRISGISTFKTHLFQIKHHIKIGIVLCRSDHMDGNRLNG